MGMMEGSEHTKRLAPFGRLKRLLAPDRQDLFYILIFAAGAGGLALATPVAVQQLINIVAFGGLVQPIFVLSLLLFAVLFFSATLRAMEKWIVEIIQQRIFIRLAAELSWRLPRVKISAFDHHYGPELVNRFFDIVTIQKSLSGLLVGGIGTLLQMVIGLAVLAFYHWWLFTFDMVLIVSVSFVVFVLGRGAVRTAIEESHQKYAVAGWLEELARVPAGVKLAGGADMALARMNELASGYLHARRGHFRIVMRQIVGMLTIQVLASTALLTLGGLLVLEGELTLGQLVAAELIVTGVVSSLSKFGKHLESYYDLLAACDKVGHLLDLPLESDGFDEFAPSVEPMAVELRNLHFAYAPGQEVLQGVSYSIPAGTSLAVLGESGSGKTTLCELLYGLRHPTGGSVLLDGMECRDVFLPSLRADVAMIYGLELITGTVIDNVVMGRRNIPMDQVRRVLRDVGVMDHILALPEGLQTVLAIDGAPLSKAQARQLMLARAMVGRPRLVIVDEVVDGLGPEERQQVMDALVAPTAPWTLVMMSHCEDVIARCAETVCLQQGRLAVVEENVFRRFRLS